MKKKKKKLRLKTSAKLFLFVLIVFFVGGHFIKVKYEEYQYTKTSDYAITNLGYTVDDLKVLNEKLNDQEKWHVANDIGYNEFLINFVKCKYFLPKNIDAYLSLTVDKDEDFWHYKKPEDYKYDDLVTKVNVMRHNEYYSNSVATDMSKGYAILANKYHYLPEDYIPEDLVKVDAKYKFSASSTIQIRSEVYDAFEKMWTAAREEEGHYLVIESGFRTYKYQKEIYDDYARKRGASYADSIAARPGYSEHQTGLALDIYSWSCSTANEFKNTKVYEWLINNSYKYGFILRYPENKDNITGYNFESWHYRYVGVDLATKVHESGLTYDEYYAFYLE